MKKLKLILLLGFLMISLSIGILLCFYLKNEVRVKQNTSHFNGSFCGTLNLPEDLQAGKELFLTNCSACHHIIKDATGPCLKDTDSLTFFKWFGIHNYSKKSRKNIKYGINFHQEMWKEKMNKEELIAIYKYGTYFSSH